MKNKKYSIVIGFLSVFFSAGLFSQENGLVQHEGARRKFDHYFYEALKAKAQERYDDAFDLFCHCYAIDSTNAAVLVELGAFHSSMDEKSLGLSFLKKAVKYDPKNYYYNIILAGLSKEMNLNQEVVDNAVDGRAHV